MPLVSATFSSGNIDETRLFLHEYGYMEMISKEETREVLAPELLRS